MYSGYLMAEHYTHRRSTAICVSSAAERHGSVTNNDGALLYFTEINENRIPGYKQYRVRCR